MFYVKKVAARSMSQARSRTVSTPSPLSTATAVVVTVINLGAGALLPRMTQARIINYVFLIYFHLKEIAPLLLVF